MLVDWLFKIANEHPLLSYIEDPLAIGDVAGYQKALEKFKGHFCQIGVKSWFGSKIDVLKEFTQLIPEESDSEASDAEE